MFLNFAVNDRFAFVCVCVCVCVERERERENKAIVIKCSHLGILSTGYVEIRCTVFATSL